MVPWAEAPPGEAKKNAFRLAKLLNCPQGPSDLMIECLRKLDGYDIIATEFDLYVSKMRFLIASYLIKTVSVTIPFSVILYYSKVIDGRILANLSVLSYRILELLLDTKLLA